MDILTTLGTGQIPLADRAYGSNTLRQLLGEQGPFANIRPRSTRKPKPVSSSFLNRYRNLVERFFSKLKH